MILIWFLTKGILISGMFGFNMVSLTIAVFLLYFVEVLSEWFVMSQFLDAKAAMQRVSKHISISI